MFKHVREHIYITFIVMTLTYIGALATINLNILNPVERALESFSLSDFYYQILKDNGRYQHNGNITIVDITTLYDRRKIGEMLEQIEECKPAVIGIDCIFESLCTPIEDSEALAESALSLSNPVFAFKLGAFDDATTTFKPGTHSFFVTPGEQTEGYTYIRYKNSGGTIREYTTMMETGGDTVYSLPFQIVRQYGIDVQDMLSCESYPINYYPTEFDVVQWDSIKENSALLRDRIVLIGATKDYTDMKFSPFGRESGTIIIAYILQDIMEHSKIVPVGECSTILLSFILIMSASILHHLFEHWSERRKRQMLRFILDTELVRNLLSLVMIATLLCINFIIFIQYHIYFDSTITIISIALLVETRIFFNEYQKHKKQQKHPHIITHKQNSNMKRILILFLLMLTASMSTIKAQELYVTYVIGKVQWHKDSKHIHNIKLSQKLTMDTKVSLGKGAKLKLLNEKDSCIYTITTAGTNTIRNLVSQEGNTIKSLAADYIKTLIKLLLNPTPSENGRSDLVIYRGDTLFIGEAEPDSVAESKQ